MSEQADRAPARPVGGTTGPATRYARSAVVGAAFAVGWTPCIGPILGAILALAASSATVAHGALLLSAWSLGLSVPFLLTGAALGAAMHTIRRLRPVMPVLEVTGGLLVIFIGALIFMDRFTIINQYFAGGAGNVTSAEEGLSAINVTGPLGFVVAFAAGFIAFVSPCVLPMVPAYIGHLTGVTAASIGDRRTTTFRHALAFVLGFTLVFVALGASVGAVGYVVRDNLAVIERIAGALLIVMGLNLLGIIRIPLLYRTYQIELEPSRQGDGAPALRGQ